jgi:hypothetical protein
MARYSGCASPVALLVSRWRCSRGEPLLTARVTRLPLLRPMLCCCGDDGSRPELASPRCHTLCASVAPFAAPLLRYIGVLASVGRL